jgi:hypothetical protein
MRSMRLLLSVTCAAVGLGACSDPRVNANIAQQLNDAATEMNSIRNDLAQVQADLDSIRVVVIKQDSTISRLAAVNNIPISR